jgi:hypothetical protein
MPATSRVRRKPAVALRRAGCVLAACAAAIAPATADVYKCAGEGKAPVYQESPCPPGKELRNFQVDPPEITVLPGKPGAGAAAPSPPKAAAGAKPDKEPNGAARAVKPKGDPAERRHLHTGMSEGEVLARVGAPDATTGAKGARQVRWTYFPADGDLETVTTVTLFHGYVTDVERRVVKK